MSGSEAASLEDSKAGGGGAGQAKGSVVLAHGVWDVCRVFRKMRSVLEEAGYHCHAIDFQPKGGRSDIRDLAGQLRDFVEEQVPEGIQADFVGFSMGGLVVRYYAQRLGGSSRMRRMVTIGTPHKGSMMAYLALGVGYRQMRPGSDLLEDLNSEKKALSPIRVASFYTPFDFMVLPPSSSIVPFASCRSFTTLLHARLPFDRKVIQATLDFLEAPEAKGKTGLG